MPYTLFKICKCGKQDVYSTEDLNLSLFDARSLLMQKACTRCHSPHALITPGDEDSVDAADFDLWLLHPEYHFWEEDEDLFLAKIANLPLLLRAIDRENIDKAKKAVVLNALCALCIDDSQDNALALDALRQRKSILRQHQNMIWPYLWKKISQLCF